MSAQFQRHPLVFSLAVLAVLLVIAIGLEVGFGADIRKALNPSSRRAAPAEAKLLPPVIATAPEQAYPETVARPLFIPTRRPAPEAPAAAQGAFTRGQFVLQGVTIAGNTRIALLREKASGRIHRVARGNEVNGIKVAEVRPDAVTLTQGGEQEVLSLDVQKPGAAPGAAIPAGPFTASAPTPAPTSPAGQAPPTAQPVASMPIQGQVPGMPSRPAFAPPAGGAPGSNPAAPAVPQATTTPMSPEELLARRRARRTQQNQ